MKILLDEDAPRQLRRYLPDHNVTTVQEMGWSGIKNGKLLDLAADDGYEILLTFDQNLRYQQNLIDRPLAVVVIVVPNKRLETIAPLVPALLAVLPTVNPGIAYEVKGG